MIDEKVLLQSRPEALNDKMNMDLQNQKRWIQQWME